MVSLGFESPDLAQALRLSIHVLMAVLLGGLLGYQRARVGKAAGVRTHMLVALGAAIFVLIPRQDNAQPSDLSRVLQGIAAGIGFIGAGTIIKRTDEGEIQGLTTAASLWLTAAIGAAAGMGRIILAVVAVVMALVVLEVVLRLEEWFERHVK